MFCSVPQSHEEDAVPPIFQMGSLELTKVKQIPALLKLVSRGIERQALAPLQALEL